MVLVMDLKMGVNRNWQHVPSSTTMALHHMHSSDVAQSESLHNVRLVDTDVPNYLVHYMTLSSSLHVDGFNRYC